MEFSWTVFNGVGIAPERAADFADIPGCVDGVAGEPACFSGSLFSRPTAPEEPESALFMSRFTAEQAGFLAFGVGACYFCRLYLNGQLLLDNSEWGNKPWPIPPRPEHFTVPAPVRQGENLLVVTVKSVPREPLQLAFRAGEVPGIEACVPSIANFTALSRASAYPPEGSEARKRVRMLIQNGVRDMRNPVFNPYAVDPSLGGGALRELEERYPILLFYEQALDRIKDELSRTVPGKDEVIFWHLYNMGYVIRTPELCFGLDLNHRRAGELEPFLDFLLTTHNHVDHYDPPLFRRMSAAGKKVVSNFHPAPGFHRPPQTLELGGVKIHTRETDHNPTLQKFVTAYYIDLPGCPVFASGDSRNVEQLEPAGDVAVFIPHPRVGLKVPEAAAKFHPRCILYSHFLEMRHCPPTPWYAVPYDLLEEEMEGVRRAGCAALAPLWGEKLVWNARRGAFV